MGILVIKKLIAGIVAVLAYTAIWVLFYSARSMTILYFLYKWLSYAGVVIYPLYKAFMVLGNNDYKSKYDTLDNVTTVIVIIVACVAIFFINKSLVFGYGVPMGDFVRNLFDFSR